jgi:putative FmdB family regulatory protein
MPIYEYRCGACGFQKEYLQRMSDAPLTDCPECGKAVFNKMVTAAGFQLKGNGWYATDFKTKATKPAKDQDKPAEAKKDEPKAKVEPASGTGTSATTGTGASPACN